MSERLKEHFWARVQMDSPDQCWPWLGATNGVGYGRVRIPSLGVSILAHRLAWQIVNGDIPPGLRVCHSCDNPICVNPHHLFVGTQRQNIADRDAKGRNSRGTRQPQAKLTDDAVRVIRRRLKQGHTIRAIAAEFGVSNGTISPIATGRGWKHVEESEDV